MDDSIAVDIRTLGDKLMTRACSPRSTGSAGFQSGSIVELELLTGHGERTVPIHHAVLAILAAGPSHGYELKATFEEAIGPQWGELNIGHLYQVLERLVRDGLVTRRPVPQRGRPNRIDYRLTRAGRRELDDWLGEPFVSQGGYRDELFLKIFSAARVGTKRLRQTIRAQRQAYMSELAALGELRRQHRHDPLVALLIEAAVLHSAHGGEPPSP